MFKSRRHDADYLNSFSVELNLSSNDSWVTGKAARPKAIAQNDHVVSTGLELFRFEYPTVSRRDFHHRKEVRRGGKTKQTFRCLPRFSEITADVVVSSHLLKHRVL